VGVCNIRVGKQVRDPGRWRSHVWYGRAMLASESCGPVPREMSMVLGPEARERAVGAG
jgi:hypothetical protein